MTSHRQNKPCPFKEKRFATLTVASYKSANAEREAGGGACASNKKRNSIKFKAFKSLVRSHKI